METIASLPQGDVRGWRDLWLTVAGPRGIAQNDWPYISGFANQSYDRDPSPASEVSIGSRNYHGDTLMALQSKLIHTLDRVRKANPLVEGIPISELRTRLHLTNDDLITYLAQAAGFTVERGAVYPEPSSTSCREGADELERLLEYLKSQGTFVEQATLPATLKLSEKECTTLLSLGVKQGSVVRLGGGLCLHREIIDSLVQRLTDQGWTEFSVADVKNVLGLSRKYVIPFLEFLDGSRITVRKGDKRVFVTRKKQIAES